jgi:hypothetical protein
MAAKIRRATYFHATVKDEPGEAYRLLALLAASNVNLLAFNAIPMGHDHTQLMLFPEHVELLARVAPEKGIILSGPHPAFLIRGDDDLGALVEIHERLAGARINVYASCGVTADCGRYGYLLYVNPQEFENAAIVLGV